MVNKYTVGRCKEIYIKKKFEDLGYYVVRSAGSKGFFDLIAIKKDSTDPAIFIQVKHLNKSKDKITKSDANKFLKEFLTSYSIINNKTNWYMFVILTKIPNKKSYNVEVSPFVIYGDDTITSEPNFFNKQ